MFCIQLITFLEAWKCVPNIFSFFLEAHFTENITLYKVHESQSYLNPAYSLSSAGQICLPKDFRLHMGKLWSF